MVWVTGPSLLAFPGATGLNPSDIKKEAWAWPKALECKKNNGM